MEPKYYVFGCLDIPNQFSDTLTVDVNTIILVIGWTPLKTNSGSLIWTTSSTSASVGRKFFGTYHLICSHVIVLHACTHLGPHFFGGYRPDWTRLFHLLEGTFRAQTFHADQAALAWGNPAVFGHLRTKIAFQIFQLRLWAPLPAAAESQQANKYESKQRDEDVTFKIWYANVRDMAHLPRGRIIRPDKGKIQTSGWNPCESIGIIGVGLGHLVTHVSSVCQVFFWTAGEASKQ